MGRRTNQAIIGAFVLGALLLGVAGVVVLSGGRFFRHSLTLVAYFDGSLEGLDVGAPVTFNGVRIGSVTRLPVVIDSQDASIRTPVFFTIDTGRLRDGNGVKFAGDKDLPKHELLVERGLRARLELQSLVTGQLVVALNFYPGTPIRLTDLSKHHPEMPTVPSSFDTFTQRVESLPIEALVAQMTRTMQSVEAVATAPEGRSALVRLDRLLAGADTLVRSMNTEVHPLATSVQQTAVATQTTMAEAQAPLADARPAMAQLPPPATAAIADYRALARDARKTIARADAQIDAVSASLQATLTEVHGVLGDDSPVRDDLTDALHEMTKAAKSLRILADYLDRHPEALLAGKRAESGR